MGAVLAHGLDVLRRLVDLGEVFTRSTSFSPTARWTSCLQALPTSMVSCVRSWIAGYFSIYVAFLAVNRSGPFGRISSERPHAAHPQPHLILRDQLSTWEGSCFNGNRVPPSGPASPSDPAAQ